MAFAPDDEQQRVARLVDLARTCHQPEQFHRIVKELDPLAKPAGPALAARLTDLAKLAAPAVGVEREELGRRQMYLVGRATATRSP